MDGLTDAQKLGEKFIKPGTVRLLKESFSSAPADVRAVAEYKGCRAFALDRASAHVCKPTAATAKSKKGK